MLTELQRKGGQVCQAAQLGQIRCPLIIRPTSEDVITGHVFQVLRAVNPRWWLPQILNRALGTNRFRQQVYRGLKIELWRNATPFPRELLPWNEGSTQVDVTITWENPPTTIFLEAKYLSPLATQTTGNTGNQGYPADQLVRNIRIGLWECGWWEERQLFRSPTREFAILLFAPQHGHQLVGTYRDLNRLRNSLPHVEKIPHFPPAPFVGELSYETLLKILRGNARWFSRPERVLTADLERYLQFKAAAAKTCR